MKMIRLWRTGGMRTAKRVAQNNRARGATTQSEVKALIIGSFPGLDDTDVRSTSRGAQGEDIQLSNHARGFLPYQIEVKRQKKCTACRWMEQAETHGGHEPLVVFREDRGEFMVCVKFKEFLRLLQEHRSHVS
jgi:hypothetical protein